jgi:hypothetical protein
VACVTKGVLRGDMHLHGHMLKLLQTIFDQSCASELDMASAFTRMEGNPGREWYDAWHDGWPDGSTLCGL